MDPDPGAELTPDELIDRRPTGELTLDIGALEDHSSPASAPQTRGPRRKFDPSLGVAARNFEAALKAEFASAIEKVRARDPKYSQLQVDAIPRARPKGTKGATPVYDAVIARVLTHTGANQTQTQIREAVQAQYPDHAVPKDWTKPMPKWAVRKLKTRIQASAAPFNAISVGEGVSLRDLHHSARAAFLKSRDGVVTYRPKVTLTDDAVFINDVAFTFSEQRKSPEAVYKFARLPMLKLIPALGEPESSRPLPSGLSNGGDV